MNNGQFKNKHSHQSFIINFKKYRNRRNSTQEEKTASTKKFIRTKIIVKWLEFSVFGLFTFLVSFLIDQRNAKYCGRTFLLCSKYMTKKSSISSI